MQETLRTVWREKYKTSSNNHRLLNKNNHEKSHS